MEPHRAEERQFIPPVLSRPHSKRSIAYMSLRLGVLHNIPFAIPFEARVNIFRSFINNDKQSLRSDVYVFDEFRHSRTNATVRRGHVAEDGFDKLADTNLKQPIQITFIDQFGEKECVCPIGSFFRFANWRRWILGWVLMAEASSRSSLLTSRRRSSTRIEGFGSRTRRMSCIPTMARMRRNVSVLATWMVLVLTSLQRP